MSRPQRRLSLETVLSAKQLSGFIFLAVVVSPGARHLPLEILTVRPQLRTAQV